MRAFVTGGNGFIGSAVVRELVRTGREVTCLLRPTSRTERIDDLPVARAAGDVRNLDSLIAGMRGCDCTIHLAAPGGWMGDDPSELRRIVEGGAHNVLTAAAQLPGHRIVLVSSTAAVNGSESPEIFDESAPFTVDDPALVYAHAKHRAELLARDAAERGVDVVVVNPAEVYGPNDTMMCTAGNLVDIAKSTPVLVCDGGTSVVHVDDVAAGVVAALDRGRSSERYILGGDNLTIRQLAELVLEIVGRRAPIVTVPRSVARWMSRWAARLPLPLPYNPHVVPYATRYWFVDATKARRELGVSFRGARETIGSTIEWLLKSGQL